MVHQPRTTKKGNETITFAKGRSEGKKQKNKTRKGRREKEKRRKKTLLRKRPKPSRGREKVTLVEVGRLQNDVTVHTPLENTKREHTLRIERAIRMKTRQGSPWGGWGRKQEV